VYEVHLERAAENDLKRLPTTTFHRIIHQIKALAENPRPSSGALGAGLTFDISKQVSSIKKLAVPNARISRE
jgi:mRNA interferase RelE/StbE